jgi:hypothetical protein
VSNLPLRLVLVLSACMLVSGCVYVPPRPSDAGSSTNLTQPSQSTAASGLASGAASATPSPQESQPSTASPKSGPVAATAQTGLYHPAFGSAERKAILNGLRPAIERDLGRKVIFEVGKLSVQGEFAFADVIPRQPSGAKIDYLKTRYASVYRNGDLDGGANAPVYALLRFRAGAWHVVQFAIGPTDVAYADWWRLYGAPKPIFPYTE